MALDGRNEGDDEGLAPVLGVGVGVVENRGQPLVDDRRRILVDGGEEQGLLAREVGIGDRAPDGRVARDVGH